MARKADPLATYNRKRDFTKTAEPAGKVGTKRAKKRIFMVQKHDATRLHYDFRLELDGTLKSWAVTRGPSLDPADNRLAVRTEDHPMSYATFEGTIPKGEYGGGTVMLWDRGTWEPEPGKDPSKTIKEGHLHFTLDGDNSAFEFSIPVSSLDTNNEARDKHMKSPEFFDVEKHKSMSFKSKKVKASGDRYEVTGEMTLMGKSNPLTVTINKTGEAPGHGGGTIAGLESMFTIKRSEFGLTAGVPALSDEVKLIVSIEAAKE